MLCLKPEKGPPRGTKATLSSRAKVLTLCELYSSGRLLL